MLDTIMILAFSFAHIEESYFTVLMIPSPWNNSMCIAVTRNLRYVSTLYIICHGDIEPTSVSNGRVISFALFVLIIRCTEGC